MSQNAITRVLDRLRNGDRSAWDDLMPLVYRSLHDQAGQLMRRERPEHTLQPTALVNEAYLRLVSQDGVQWEDRLHFHNAAAQAMRRVLVDGARARLRQKRGGTWIRVPLEDRPEPDRSPQIDVLDLDRALSKLAEEDARSVRVVELLHFGGMTVRETGEVLGISERTVKRDWQFARAWLRRELRE